MKSLDKDEAKRIVNTYSDLILRLSYTYLTINAGRRGYLPDCSAKIYDKRKKL